MVEGDNPIQKGNYFYTHRVDTMQDCALAERSPVFRGRATFPTPSPPKPVCLEHEKDDDLSRWKHTHNKETLSIAAGNLWYESMSLDCTLLGSGAGCGVSSPSLAEDSRGGKEHS